jgi:decaprenylphospho-beta-D-ribofuranose 2-oxidase
VNSPASREETLTGWGNFPRETCRVFRPENQREERHVLTEGAARTYIARGRGRSYSDASLNAGEGVVSQLRLNRLIDFDPESGVLTCEAGTTLREIVDTFFPRGFYLDVTPGTAHVTVGGAIAADVHGKNHRSRGSFSASVEQVRLLLPDGTELDASRTTNRELFAATAGGMGLTGFITRASLRLRRVDSRAFGLVREKTRSLAESIEVLERMSGEHEHSICWIDALHHREVGRGLVEGADYVSAQPPSRKPRHLAIPITGPGWVLNRWSVGAFNRIRYRRAGKSHAVVHVDDFNYPLDGIAQWPRLYGSRGFMQYQAVVPLAEAGRTLPEILQAVKRSGHHAFLVTLKRFGKGSEGLISFPMEGVTAALDFPIGPGLETLSSRLDDIVADAGGRVYLAKNPWLKPGLLSRMYPRLEEFLAIKASIDPSARLASSLSRRVGLTP